MAAEPPGPNSQLTGRGSAEAEGLRWASLLTVFAWAWTAPDAVTCSPGYSTDAADVGIRRNER